jgi:hypothetical protein
VVLKVGRRTGYNSSAPAGVAKWQTQRTQNASEKSMRVRIPLPAPPFQALNVNWFSDESVPESFFLNLSPACALERAASFAGKLLALIGIGITKDPDQD